MAVLAIAFCWAHKIGKWQNEVKPIKIKKHGRKAISIFRRGLNILRRILCGLAQSKTEMVMNIRLLFAPPQGARLGVTL